MLLSIPAVAHKGLASFDVLDPHLHQKFYTKTLMSTPNIRPI